MFLVEDVQKEWRNLKKSYFQNHTKHTKSTYCQRKKQKTCIYHKQLSFLSSCITNGSNTSSSSSPRDSDHGDYENIDDTDQRSAVVQHSTTVITDDFENSKLAQNTPDEVIFIHQDTNEKSRKNVILERTFENRSPTPTAKSSYQRNHEMPEDKEDSERYFMLSLVDDLKKVPPHRMTQVKLNLIQCLLNGRKIEDDSSTKEKSYSHQQQNNESNNQMPSSSSQFE